jgi:uncharacterized membrane protein
MFEKTIKKSTDLFKVYIYRMGSERNIQFSPKFSKFIEWYLYTGMPFILKVATYIIALWLFNKFHTKYGFEKVVIILLVLLLLKSHSEHE